MNELPKHIPVNCPFIFIFIYLFRCQHHLSTGRHPIIHTFRLQNVQITSICPISPHQPHSEHLEDRTTLLLLSFNDTPHISGWQLLQLVSHFRMAIAPTGFTFPDGNRSNWFHISGWKSLQLVSHFRMEIAPTGFTFPDGNSSNWFHISGWQLLQLVQLMVAASSEPRIPHVKWNSFFQHNFCVKPYLCTQRTREVTRVIVGSMHGIWYDIYPTLHDFFKMLVDVSKQTSKP